ncbi:MAG: hypothetical protein N4A35_05655 [Flavobacteriales bacterium]|jgi:predicted ThiF/HesA family dinucleotide-utilizing enzyme|nr:hypothetical protein [Flavobacteriales bacterium]
MEFNKNDIEYYLLTKDYDNLSPDELKLVHEAITTKEEYDAMRQLLLVMEEAPVESELVPNPALKESLVAAFEKTRWEQGIETKNDVKVVPIQQEQERKNKGFFWFSIAASIALLIGVFVNRENLFMPEHKELAMLEEDKVDAIKELEKEIHKEKSITVDENVNEEEAELERETVVVELAESGNKAPVIAEEPSAKKEAPAFEFSTATSQGHTNQMEGDQLAVNEKSNTRAFDTDELADAETVVVTKELAEELDDLAFSDQELSSVTVATQQDKKVVKAYKSQSLESDKEMIDLFYTAL